MSFTRKSLLAATPTTTRGQALQLSADPKNEQFLYTNGRSVYIRQLANPAVASEYTEHTCAATVARWSPSGYYVASGDVHGNVRIWDATQETHLIKLETRPISSRINDIAWDSESKRLIAVGEGKERYGHAFSFDTGNSVGEIIGHSKVINACSIRSNRPFRAATCSDDMTVNFYHGPPFKFQKSLNDHTRFVQCVRFSPDGNLLASVGSDGKIFLYDGATGDKVGEVTEGAHAGGIFSLSWSPDSKQFMTSSADMTVKIWDVASRKAVNTVAFSGTVGDQQVGNLWAGNYLLSAALSGDIHYLDPRSDKPVRTVYGHQKAITSFTVKPEDSLFFTGSYDGRVYVWSAEKQLAQPVAGHGHSNQVSAFHVAGNKVYSVGMDDTLRCIDASKKAFDDLALPTEAVPKAVTANKDVVVVATVKDIQLIKNGSKLQSIPMTSTPLSLAVSPDGSEVAVGTEDMKIHLFTVSPTSLTKKQLVLQSNRGQITALAYAPNGSMLAAGDSDRKIVVYDAKTGAVKITEWVFHSARVNCIAWAKDSLHAVSGGLDRDVYVWSVEKPMKYIAIKGAHQDGVTGVAFADSQVVVSTGQDASVKVWSVEFHQ